MRIAFADVETTGTEPDRHYLWELGMVLRTPGEPDAEYLWQFRPDLTTADPMALKIGGYYARNDHLDESPNTVLEVRHPDTAGSGGTVRTVAAVALDIALTLDGVILAAANVRSFDAAFLAKFLRANGQAPSWDYHLLEVESYAAGALRLEPPWKLNSLLAAAGVTVPEGDRHSALGDARAIRDLYDAVRKTPEPAS